MPSFKRLYPFLLLITLVASACQPIQPAAPVPMVSAPATPSPTTNTTVPRFMRTACLYRIPPGENVTCGYLIVPEVRSQPTEKAIRLHVVILKSTAAEPAADPLILLNGGPGSPGRPMLESMLYDLIGEVWRAKRDVIYLDQRGTGFSMPSLYCPETAMDKTLVATMRYTESVAAETAGLRQCYERLHAEGINVAAYTVAESAADINDLRLALGYEKVNLYGFSYGSLLAAAIMRDYPTAIRSVVLDSVLPLGIDVVQEKPHCLQSGLDALLAGCAADAACHAAYPDLEAHFYAVLDRLQAAPVTIKVTSLGEAHRVAVDDLKFLTYIFFQLQMGIISPQPRQIEVIFDGNYEAPALQWLAYASTQAMPASRLTQTVADGMYYSTMCNYAAGLAVTADQEAAPCEPCTEGDARHPSVVAYARFMLAPCTFWESGAAPARLVTPLATNNIPTLLLTGAYDCALPPYLSQASAATWVNSYHFVLPVGHAVVGSRCGLYLTDQFLTDPTTRPDAACVDSMQVYWSTR